MASVAPYLRSRAAASRGLSLIAVAAVIVMVASVTALGSGVFSVYEWSGMVQAGGQDGRVTLAAEARPARPAARRSARTRRTVARPVTVAASAQVVAQAAPVVLGSGTGAGGAVTSDERAKPKRKAQPKRSQPVTPDEQPIFEADEDDVINPANNVEDSVVALAASAPQPPAGPTVEDDVEQVTRELIVKRPARWHVP